MTIDRLPVWLEQMHEAASQALAYVDGMDKDGFVADKRTQQAVVLNLLVIGELAAKLIEQRGDFVTEHPRIAWASMKGMRNRIAHGYFECNGLCPICWFTCPPCELPPKSDPPAAKPKPLPRLIIFPR